ncbi:glutamate ABC transporter substrate-binding protein [Streptomyces gobiensis]|uniref:glutamate ABC transporter substrate-binding protein n=1 Tax=Streptomyces gobiensis TaxID=2875706 RepID=UPI001E5B7344|nr:glutamate ABC transporter substrate-binding protein [Streptomyces gobiensis]UGY91446.1 glutamate ABC transporter substrate-binding protein [Streptomyces gobiensis]
MARERDRKFGAMASAGLALVLAVLLSSVLPVRGNSDHDERLAGGTAAAARAAVPAAAPERETCADGSDPAASLRPSGAAGPAVTRIQKAKQLVVGVDQNSYLWGYRDPNTGEITGFDIDLVRAIAEDLLGKPAKVVYRTIPTDQRVKAIENGDVDMVVRTMTINCERLQRVSFSTAYFEAGQQVLAPRTSRVQGYDASLKGRRVCTAEGSTGESALTEESHGAHVVAVPNQLDCLVRLQLGEVDAVITDSALAAGQAAQDPSVRLVGDPFTVEPYGVAMNREDKDLVRRVNKVLDDFRKGGTSSAWMTSYERWLAGMMEDPGPKPPTPAYRD